MMPITQEERFWSKVGREGPDNCWLWLFSHDSKGYGNTRFNKTRRLSHRVAWEIAYGPISNHRMFVCHSCDNRLCCNPAHLFLGTPKDNAMDMARKKRCGRSNLPGWLNGNARLTPKDITEIRRLRDNGMKVKDIAVRYGVTPAHIGNVYHRRRWYEENA